jgi:plastocyanin
MDKEYVVTLHRKEDLEQFYNEMQLTNFPLVMKRPLSRNTHYMMTEEQAERLREDPRVWGVEEVDRFELRSQVNNEPYTVSGDFFKNAPQGSTINANLRQWGHLHCAGNQAQRRKSAWGDPTSTEIVSDSVDVFNSGKHVDVVIVDDPVSYDSKEWESPSQPGVSRFVQYQWFNELNAIVNSIDDDGQTEPSGTITYGTNAASASYHGIHVTGTACGQHYGWAQEANIYNLAVTDSWPSGQQVGALLIFDYLRAFHLNKPINTTTGKRNPTITNHSYGGIYNMPNGSLAFGDVTQVVWQGVTYNAGNPGPSGWTQAGVEADFGLRFGVDTYPAWSSAVAADVQDAIDDGVVIIGAAGNDNMLMAEVNDANWNNLVTINGVGTIYLNRGAWPNSPDSGAINVGALSDHSQFRRSTYTQFGPAIDVFAPGDDILSSYGNTGFPDNKYGAGNYYYPIPGTSMASPQVCGVIACLATGKERFTQADARGYLNQYSVYGDMTFDVSGGGLNDNSCRQGSPNKYLHIQNPRAAAGFIREQRGERTTGQTFPRISIINAPAPISAYQTFTINVTAAGAADYIFNGTDRTTTHVNALDPVININAGDTIEFVVNAIGHPFWIKYNATTGTSGFMTNGIVLNNGSQTNTVSWQTGNYTPGPPLVTPGTYYYICQFHAAMVGTIVVS